MVDRQVLRWLQRFENFQRALQTLERAVQLSQQRELTELEQQGLIQGFEFTHELAWNVVKDYLQEKGFSDVIGLRDATRLAFKNRLIVDGVTPTISSWRNPSLPRSSAVFSPHFWTCDLALSV